MHRSLVLFLGAFAAQAASVLDTWQGAWTPYRMTDDQGRERRLLKATIDLASPRPGRLLLRDSAGAVLDTEHIPRARKGRWAHGFWIPAAHAGNATLELQTGSEVAARKITLPAAAPGNALPLRLDRLNHTLLERLRRREEASRPGGSADVAAYLRQHDIVYRHPSPGWGKACPSATAMSAFW